MAHAAPRAGTLIAAALLAVAFTWPAVRATLGSPVADAALAGRVVPEWPIRLHDRPVRPLAMSDVEQRFAKRFPGAIGRFTDGQSTWVLRQVERPTRMLHPATDCYQGLGYIVRAERLVATSGGLERCFIAARAGETLEVCEHIVDAKGRVFTDTSAWYWAAMLGRSRGPWRAMTRATSSAAASRVRPRGTLRSPRRASAEYRLRRPPP